MHGGRKQRKVVRIDHLPHFYSKRLNGTLGKFIEDSLATPPGEQLDLYAELAMMRHVASEAASLYEAAVDMTPEPGKELAKQGAVMACATVMQEALNMVADMAGKISGIERNATDKVSAGQLSFIVAQIVRIAHETMPDEYARTFEASMREKVRIQTGPQGTTLTPDMDAVEMDGTVPNIAGPATEETDDVEEDLVSASDDTGPDSG